MGSYEEVEKVIDMHQKYVEKVIDMHKMYVKE